MNLAAGHPYDEAMLLRRIEEANFNGFPSEIVHMDGAWVTRLAPGNPARRVNSLNIFDPEDTADLDGRLDHARSLFQREGVPFHLRSTPLTPTALGERCDGCGWAREGETLVLLRSTDRVASAPERAGEVSVLVEPLKNWLTGFAEIGGTRPEAVTPEAVNRLGRALSRVAGEVIAFIARDEAGRPVGTAIATIDRDLVGIYDVAVAPAARRRGLGARLVEKCLDAGSVRGCAYSWLQVTAENEPARRLYGKLGFSGLYTYHYRRPPD
ncbi:GNAT family N-acetyltransferase [Stappia sp. GBMRC 2046]|uniref:GNAT family N-acetyltransferase n=1 Tax=Stappia sediminis TaxID=2692190 RepID=A0A7X3LU59_9HYPH|nr:GNAT family N-acetyltransferase [Stappia sediminis]MXN65181.1 GNAT family N-acetyltransferase [Stappia sediminis]